MSSYFPCGVGAVEYVLSHNLLVLAGWSDAAASEQGGWALIRILLC